MLLLLSLTLLLATAALALVVRMRCDGRAEQVVAGTLVWNLLVLLPIYTLGFLHALDKTRLALAAVFVGLAALGLSSLGKQPRAHARDVGRAALGLLRLPVDAFRIAIGAGSAATLGLVAVVAIVLWTTLLSYLFTSDGWDGIYYHEPMIGFALQNRGITHLVIPPRFWAIDAYVRHSEYTSLWFVAFWDRRLIEVVQDLMVPCLFAATYLLVKRFSRDKAAALTWSCAVITIPGCALELRSTYVDVHVAAANVAALHFVTRPVLRRKDVWVVAVSLAMVAGLKNSGIAFAPLLGFVGLVRIIAQNRDRIGATLASVAGGLGVVLLGCVWYFRNIVVYRNPIWPTMLNRFNPGAALPGHGSSDTPVLDMSGISLNRPLPVMYQEALAPFVAGHDFADIRSWGYGFFVPLFILPLAALAFVVLVGRMGKNLALARGRRLGSLTDDAGLLGVVVLAGIMTALSPALWQARYNFPLVVALFCLCAWLCAVVRAPRASDALGFSLICVHLLQLQWSSPGWGISFASMREVLAMRAADRVGHAGMHWVMPVSTAQARERELGPGDVVAYTDDVEFTAELWNERFTNRVEYLEPAAPEQMLAKADALKAEWVVTSPHSGLAAVLERDKRWQKIGSASNKVPLAAWRRVM